MLSVGQYTYHASPLNESPRYRHAANGGPARQPPQGVRRIGPAHDLMI